MSEQELCGFEDIAMFFQTKSSDMFRLLQRGQKQRWIKSDESSGK